MRPVAFGELAAHIPDARYIEYPGSDHAFFSGDVEAMLGDIQEFVTGERDSEAIELERVLAIVLKDAIAGLNPVYMAPLGGFR